MFKLLNIEWLKVRRYSTFWILLGIFAALLIGWNQMISSGLLKPGGGKMNILSSSYTFPNVWDNVSYYTKLFAAFFAIIVVILTTNEYQFRTNRQNILDGWNRSQFFHAKWLLVISLSLFITVFTFLLGIAFAVINKSSFDEFSNHIEKIGYVFVLTMNYFGFALTLSLLLRKSGMSIMIFLIFCFIFEVIVQQLLNWKFHESLPGNFMPMQCSAELFHLPMLEQLNDLAGGTKKSNSPLLLASGVWIGIYYFIGRYRVLKSDL